MKKKSWYKDCRLWLILFTLLPVSAVVILLVTCIINAEWAGIFFALLVGIAGIFQETIRSCIFRPKLNISFIPEPPDAHKVASRDKKTGEFQHYRYYFRFKVENEGSFKMKDVQVVVVECYRKVANGSFIKLKDFLPLNLEWAHFKDPQNPYSMPTIFKDFYRHCSFGYLTESKDAELEKFGRAELLNECKVVLTLGTVWQPYSGEHILPPGDYKIKAIVAGENLTAEPVTFSLHLENEWSNSVDTMFSINSLSVIGSDDC